MEERRLRAEKEVAQRTLAVQNRTNLALSSMSLLSDLDLEESRLTSDLKGQVAESLAIIQKVATKSGNLKGTFTKALKEAAKSIAVAVDTLAQRTVTEEVATLRAHNTKLQQEMLDMQKQVSLLRSDLDRSCSKESSAERQIQKRPDKPSRTEKLGAPDVLARSIMIQVGTMVNARLEALEDRLLPAKSLRPPLATRRTPANMASTSAASETDKSENGKVF